jgi:hypothetical protein
MPILFALDRSEGPPPSARKLVLTCTLDTCRHQADYSAAAVSRFRKDPPKPGDVAGAAGSGKSKKHKVGA